jgi:type VI secretion system protein
MKGSSLLARIRKPELAAPRRAISDREMRDSILEHLHSMCVTRQGTMLTCPDYGICDVSELVHEFPDAIAKLAKAIRHTIEAYEPRLANVVVRHVPSDSIDLTLRFEIVANIVAGKQRTPVKFETSLDVSRKLTIR